MRCDGCQHWKKAEEDWEAQAIGFGLCVAVKARWKITDKATIGMEWDDEGSLFAKLRKDALRESRAYVQDGSEYRAELLTAPNFFCALYKSKQKVGYEAEEASEEHAFVWTCDRGRTWKSGSKEELDKDLQEYSSIWYILTEGCQS